MPGRTLKNFSERSEPDRTTQRLADVGYLGKAGIDEFLGKTNVGILGSNPHDRCIEMVEKLLGSARRDLGAEPSPPQYQGRNPCGKTQRIGLVVARLSRISRSERVFLESPSALNAQSSLLSNALPHVSNG